MSGSNERISGNREPYLGRGLRSYQVSAISVFSGRRVVKFSDDFFTLFGAKPSSVAIGGTSQPSKEIDMGPNKRLKVDSITSDADGKETEPVVEEK